MAMNSRLIGLGLWCERSLTSPKSTPTSLRIVNIQKSRSPTAGCEMPLPFQIEDSKEVKDYKALSSKAMIPALGARGPEFKSRTSPFSVFERTTCLYAISRLPAVSLTFSVKPRVHQLAL